MIDVRPTNAKLWARAVHIVTSLTGLTDDAALKLIQKAGGRAKVALVMHHAGVSAARARDLLVAHKGSLRAIVGDLEDDRRRAQGGDIAARRQRERGQTRASRRRRRRQPRTRRPSQEPRATTRGRRRAAAREPDAPMTRATDAWIECAAEVDVSAASAADRSAGAAAGAARAPAPPGDRPALGHQRRRHRRRPVRDRRRRRVDRPARAGVRDRALLARAARADLRPGRRPTTPSSPTSTCCWATRSPTPRSRPAASPA